MTPKLLRWWSEEFDRAVATANALYNVRLYLDQFCACRGIDPEDRNTLLSYMEKTGRY